jgi:hypothetical protein
MTMIGAIALDGWRGFNNIDAPTDGDVFLAFVQQQLRPETAAGRHRRDGQPQTRTSGLT